AAPHSHIHSIPTRRSSDLAFENQAREMREIRHGPLSVVLHVIGGVSYRSERLHPSDLKRMDYDRQVLARSRLEDWMELRLAVRRSEEHTSELQSLRHLVCR